MEYLYILNYGINPGFYMYKIPEFTNVEEWIEENTDFNLDEVNYMIDDQIRINTYV